MKSGRQASIGSAVTTEVLANLFQAVVDEMAWIIVRSAHTTFVKETQDFGAALVTPTGEMFAFPYLFCATSQVGMPASPGISAFEWEPGDVLITNDPYITSGMVMHLNDVVLMKPIFIDGRLLCFAWGFLHFTDVGGYAPGSIDMRNSEIFQEGMRLRPAKLYRKGVLDAQLWQVFADNCRIPTLNWGDLSALIAALSKAEDRMTRLVEKYGFELVASSMEAVIAVTESQTRRVLSQVPAGHYGFTEYFEDDYVSDLPVKLKVDLFSNGEGSVTLDFTGSDPQVRSALNLPTGGQRHHPFLTLALTNFVVTRSETMHINAGIQRCIDLILPAASVVNATFPAACGMRWTTAMRLHDLVLGALNTALPGSVPASGVSQVVVTYVSTSELGTAGRVVVANPVVGGTGGGPHLDGVSGTDFPCAFLRNVPVEILESEMPVIVHEFSLLPDSEGPGEFRGGFGIRYDLEIRHPSAVVVMRGKDRYRFQAWGIYGGGAGSSGTCFSVRLGDQGKVEHTDIGKVTVYRPQMGEVISIQGGGGGGYGDPLHRQVDLVLADVTDGLISSVRALDDYGVVIRNSVVCAPETADQRERMRTARGSLSSFDPGRGRRDWEARFGIASDLISSWLQQVPIELRHYAKEQAFRALEKLGPGPYGEADVAPVLRALQHGQARPTRLMTTSARTGTQNA